MSLLPTTGQIGENCRRETLSRRYRQVRDFTLQLTAPLEPEDCVIQSMPDVSPTRWHLAHTTWFFETFALRPAGVPAFHEAFEFLFNSYYNQVGRQFPRAQRGLLSRPTVAEVLDYRRHVDQLLLEHLAAPSGDAALEAIELGLHHEQQHQELMLTDIKHVLSCNPLSPAYQAPRDGAAAVSAAPLQWLDGVAGVHEIGHGAGTFCFDNERPRHSVLVAPHQIASRLTTCGEYFEFMADGGYQRPELWLSLGWQQASAESWSAPLYWVAAEAPGTVAGKTAGTASRDCWRHFTLGGLQPLDWEAPVTHVSYFEADAYARWRGARLPTEPQWELAVKSHAAPNAVEAGNFAEAGWLHPRAGAGRQFLGDAWEWTSSPYLAYPGYRPPSGALGEYNGKFMCNQYVLRGGSCATPQSHIRTTYRNFFPPDARWQFTGIRLARDV